MSRGQHTSNTSALDLGLFGLILCLIAAPFILAWMAWRAATNRDY